jgi:hypothetical protein
MERVAGCILLRLHQKYRLVSVDQIPKVWMRIIGIYKFLPRTILPVAAMLLKTRPLGCVPSIGAAPGGNPKYE